MFSSVSLTSCIWSLHFCSPSLKKRLHLDFLFFSLFCSAFPASNSLQIFVRSYLSKWAEVKIALSLRWTRSHRSVTLGQTEPFRCNRKTQLGVTDFTAEKTICHLFLYFCSSSTQWFLSSTSITFYMLLCSVTQGPNLVWITLQKISPWKLMSKGEREITSKLNHTYRGREYSRGERVIIKDPRCLVFKRREVTCLQEGKDMFIFARLH